MMWKILPFFVALFVVGLGSPPQGGERDISVNDPGFQRALQYAVDDYNSNSEDEHIYAVEKVMRARIEMEEERVKYTISTKLGKTFCTKHRHTGFCPIIRNPRQSKFLLCSFTVLKHRGMKMLNSRCKEITQWD